MTFAVAVKLKLMITCPVAVSDGVAKFWVPLFGHSIAWPPEAAASLTTAKGAKLLWPARLSSSTANALPLAPPDELELLELELLELELLEDDELKPLEDDELELLELDEDELEELELELLDDEPELSAGGVPLNPSCPSRVIASTR